MGGVRSSPGTPDGDWDWGNWAHYIEDRRSKLSTNVSFSERRLNLPSWLGGSVRPKQLRTKGKCGAPVANKSG